MIHRTAPVLRSCLILPIAFWLTGCGDSPPSGDVQAAIAQAVRNVRADLFQGTAESCDVVSASAREWKKEGEMQGGGGQKVEGYSSEWTAKLRVKEPIGYVILLMDGKYVGKTVLKPGEEYPFGGSIEAPARRPGLPGWASRGAGRSDQARWSTPRRSPTGTA